MKSQIVSSAILAIALSTSGGYLAIAAPRSPGTVTSVEAHRGLSEGIATTTLDLNDLRTLAVTYEHALEMPELAQLYPAAAPFCYTFAGPVCPMRVVVAVGAPCTCFFPNGALPGLAGY